MNSLDTSTYSHRMDEDRFCEYFWESIGDWVNEQMMDDPEPIGEQLEYLWGQYELGSDRDREVINMTLTAIIGWQLPTILNKGGDNNE